MRLSTIIPVYNAEKFLERCLDSVLGQNLADAEIICVDDGSADSSWEILQAYRLKYNNIQTIRQNNSYAGAARNHGLENARGEYVHFLDADDYVFPNVYKEVCGFAESMEIDYVKFRSKCFSMVSGVDKSKEHADYTCSYLNPTDFGRIVSLKDHSKELLEWSTHVPWAGFYRRTFLKNNKIFFNRLKCVNDRSFYIKVITGAKQIAYMDKYVVCHQIDNPDSLIGKRGNHYECHFISYNLIKEHLADIKVRLGEELYRRILTLELHDMLCWFCNLTMLQKERIAQETDDFFGSFDWSEINQDEKICSLIKRSGLLL